MPATLDITHKEMSVFSGHINMSDIGLLENPIIDTKFRMCFFSVENYSNLFFDSAQLAAILEFYII